MSEKDMFTHDSHDANKRLDPLKNFYSGDNMFYDIFKTELAHTDFYWNEKGLRRGNDDTDILDLSLIHI